MASDDDVLIKIAADIAEAVAALGTLIESFKGIAEGLKTVEGSTVTTNEVMVDLMATMEKSINTSGKALETMGTKITEAVEAIGEAVAETKANSALLVKALEAVEKAAKESAAEAKKYATAVEKAGTESVQAVGGITKLKETFAALEKQQAENVAAITKLSQAEREEIVKLSQSLLDAGVSFKAVADAAGLTTGALTLLMTEQQKLSDAIIAARDPIVKMEEAYAESMAQRAKESEKLAALNDDEKESIAALAQKMLDAGKSYEKITEVSGLSAESIKDLIKEQDKLKESSISTADRIKKLWDKVLEVDRQRAESSEKLAALTDQEREAIGQHAAVLLKAGESHQKLADDVGLSVEALQELVAEQEPVKSFFQTCIEGFSSMDAAAVTAGVVMAHAFEGMVGVIGDIITSMPDMVREMANVGDQLQTMANRLNLTAEAIAELKYISDVSGASMEQMARSIQTFGADSQVAGSKTQIALQSIGIAVKDLKGDSEENFFQVIKHIQQFVPESEQAAKAIAVFGTKFRNSTMLLNEPIGDLRQRFRDLGGLEGIGALAKAGDDFNDALVDVKVAVDGLGRAIAVEVLPPLTEFIKAFPLATAALQKFGGVIMTTVPLLIPLMANMVDITGTGKDGFGAAMEVSWAKTKKFSTALVEIAGAPFKGFYNALKSAGEAVRGFATVLSDPGKLKQFFVDLGASAMSFYKVMAANVGKGFAVIQSGFAAIGPLMSSFGTYMAEGAASMLKFGKSLGSLSGMKEAFMGVASGIGGVIKKLFLLNVALLTNPFFLMGAAIVALGVLLYKMTSFWNPIIQLVKDLWTIARSTFGDLIKWFTSASSSGGSLKDTINNIKLAVISAIEWFEGWFKFFREIPGLGLLLIPIEMEFKAIAAIVNLIGDGLAWLGAKFKEFVSSVHGSAEAIRQKEEADRKAKEEADNLAKSTGAVKSAIDLANEAIRDGKDAYATLTAAQKAQMASLKELKGMNEKEIASMMNAQIKLANGSVASFEAAEVAVRMWAKSVEDAKKAASKDPFKKFVEDVQELHKEIKVAAEGNELTVLIDQFGKKAQEVVREATLKKYLEKLPPIIHEIAKAANEMDLAEKLGPLQVKAQQIVTAFGATIKAGVTAAEASLAAGEKKMADDLLVGRDARLAAIEAERVDRIRMINADVTEKRNALRQENLDIERNALKQLQIAKDNARAMGKTATDERVKLIEQERADNLAKNRAAMGNLEGMVGFQILQANKLAEHAKGLETATTANYEANAKARGVITQAARAEEIANMERQLVLMEDILSAATEKEKDELRKAIALKKDVREQEMRDMGLTTDQMVEQEIMAMRKKLMVMRQMGSGATAAEIKDAEEALKLKENVWEREMAKRGIITKAAAKETARQEKDKLDEMLRHEKDFTKEQIAEQKRRLRASEDAAGRWQSVWAAGIRKVSAEVREFGAAFTQLGEAMNSDKLKKFGAALDIGSMVMDGIAGILEAKDTIGMVIAAAKLAIQMIGKMWDSMTESKGEKAAKSVGRNFEDSMGKALKVTEEFGDEIAKVAEDMFGGSDFQAQLYKMSDIIEEAGGLSAHNFEDMTARLRDVFVQIGQGSFTVETATKILDENFGTFAKHVLESGKIASAGFQELIQLNAKSGTNSKEVMDFVVGQTARLGTAISKLASPFEKVAKLTDDLAKAKEKVKGGVMTPEQTAEIGKLTAELAKAKGALGDTGAAMGRFERLAVAGFNAAIKSGAGYIEAMKSMSPALDTIIKAHKALGTTAGPAIEELLKFRDVATEHEDLVESAASLNEVMLSLSNIGGLNVDTMADLQTQGQDTFNQLQEAGFSEAQSLQQMKGYLEQVRNAHTQLGLPIDENTQKLIDSAETQGILAKEQISTNDVLREGLSAVIEALGGKIPDAFKKAAAAGATAATQIGDSMNKNVNATLDAQKDKLDKAGWAGYAAKGVAASTVTKDALTKVDKAVGGVDKSLDGTDWDGWAREAAAAAKTAEDAVNGVSVGHSPGGIKEIPIKLREAIAAFKLWERQGIVSASAVERAVNGVSDTANVVADMNQTVKAGVSHDMNVQYVRDQQAERSMEQLEESISDIARQAAEHPIAVQITAIDSQSMEQAVESKILPSIVNAIRNNRRQNRSNLRQVLGVRGEK